MNKFENTMLFGKFLKTFFTKKVFKFGWGGGIRTPGAASRGRCLTTWRLPNKTPFTTPF